MATMIPKLQSQLRAVSNKLKECEIANNSLLFEIDKQKLRITTSEMNIGFLEDSKRKLIESLADKYEKISCLEGIIQHTRQPDNKVKKKSKNICIGILSNWKKKLVILTKSSSTKKMNWCKHMKS